MFNKNIISSSSSCDDVIVVPSKRRQRQQQQQKQQRCCCLVAEYDHNNSSCYSSSQYYSYTIMMTMTILISLLSVVHAKHEVPTKKAIPPLMDPPPTLPEITDKVWMKFAIDGKVIGTLEFGLFGKNSPKVVKNFIELSKCTHTGKYSKKKLCYKNNIIHRIIPSFAFQGGDITHGDGTGGESIYGGRFVADNEQQEKIVKFTRKYLLATAGNKYNMFGSQFFITTVKTQWLTGKHIAFGIIVNTDKKEVDDIIQQIESVGTYGGKPKAVVSIVDVGMGKVTEDDKKPHY